MCTVWNFSRPGLGVLDRPSSSTRSDVTPEGVNMPSAFVWFCTCINCQRRRKMAGPDFKSHRILFYFRSYQLGFGSLAVSPMLKPIKDHDLLINPGVLPVNFLCSWLYPPLLNYHRSFWLLRFSEYPGNATPLNTRISVALIFRHCTRFVLTRQKDR